MDTGLDWGWTYKWEADLSDSDHETLTKLLAAIYPAHAATFTDKHSWSGAKPEVRVIGYIGTEPVAHLGFVRRLLRVEGDELGVMVADAGLIGVHPSYQGNGVGLMLLKHSEKVFRQLKMPFAFLTCRPAVVPFYENGGWKQIPNQVVKMIDNNYEVENYTGPALVQPIMQPLDAWPANKAVIRDGLEV